MSDSKLGTTSDNASGPASNSRFDTVRPRVRQPVRTTSSSSSTPRRAARSAPDRHRVQPHALATLGTALGTTSNSALGTMFGTTSDSPLGTALGTVRHHVQQRV
ncbi:hypothetical protein [Streptodolium elevatio]